MDIHADALQEGLSSPIEPPQNSPIAPDIETASEVYARRFSGDIGACLLAEQTAAVAWLLDRLPPSRLQVLEVGGGHAQLTPLFAARGHAVAVHGSSNACFARVHDVQSRYPGSVRYLMGSLERLPAADRAFDLVCSIRLLGHFAGWEALIAEKCRVARRFVICEFSTTDGAQRLAKALFRMKLHMEPDTRPFRAFHPEEIEGELRKNGFRSIYSARQFVLPIALHRKLRSPVFTRTAESIFRGMGVTALIGSPMIVLAERMSDGEDRSQG